MTINDFLHLQPASHKRKKAYKVGVHIGAGGYGEVKQATALELDNRQVAIKIVPKIHVRDLEEQVDRQDELAKLNHPHVVKLIEWFESREKYYIVFELASGGELYDHLIEEGRFGEDEAREVAYALVDAVTYLHSHNIIHRDLKPENILYRTPPGTNGVGHDDCVVSDFGLALKLDSPTQVLHTHCGSPGYSAPEVYSDEGYSLPADMWSVGVIVFALMGGRFPYKEVEPRALAEEARATKLYFPPTPWNGISENAKNFIKGLLRVNPKKRMTAAEALTHPWLRTAMSRPASPHHSPDVTPPATASAADRAFSTEHPALDRLKLSETPLPSGLSALSTAHSTSSVGSRPLIERRETHQEGDATPGRVSPVHATATEFPPLEKRSTHLADEDEFAIM